MRNLGDVLGEWADPDARAGGDRCLPLLQHYVVVKRHRSCGAMRTGIDDYLVNRRMCISSCGCKSFPNDIDIQHHRKTFQY